MTDNQTSFGTICPSPPLRHRFSWFDVRIKIIKNTLLLISVGLLNGSLAYADERFELNEIIVSGNYQDQTVEQLPKSIAVITAEDIKQAPSTNLAQLLSREANITFSDVSANGKFSSIDIRGMGATSSSNVVIMVNGVRLNTSDLAAPDLSSIPLSQIKRIEIIRGASGVRYGNGAVGGVINIITEPLNDISQYQLYAFTGSYDTQEYRASAQQSFEQFSLDAYISDYTTDGYRDNGQLEKKSARLGAQFYLTDYTTIKASITDYEDEYGLPGTVSQDRYSGNNSDRQHTNTPDDGGETEDTFYSLTTEIDFLDSGFLQINANSRDRTSTSILNFNPNISRQNQQFLIKENADSLDITHEIDFQTFKISMGVNANLTELLRNENGSDIPDQSARYTNDISDYSAFLITDFHPVDKLNINIGYRYNQFNLKQKKETYRQPVPITTDLVDQFGNIIGSFVETFDGGFITEGSSNETWRNYAADLGAIYNITPTISTYVSLSRSYRNPNTDELVLSDSNLHPQKGKHADTGFRFKNISNVEASVNFFFAEIEDEIFFGLDLNSGLKVNKNSEEKTERYGSEIDFKYYPVESVYLWTTLGYTHATFKETDAFVPLVPEITATLGAEWTPISSTTISLTTDYVDDQFDGNDLSNTQYSKLSSSLVFNTKIIYSIKYIELFAGINNLLDEVYATGKFSDTYYAMPDRNYYAGMSINF